MSFAMAGGGRQGPIAGQGTNTHDSGLGGRQKSVVGTHGGRRGSMTGTLPQLKLLALTDLTEEEIEIESPRSPARRSSRVGMSFPHVTISARRKEKRGSRTDRLARPNDHEVPRRPPTVGNQTYLPGLNERYHRRLRTPIHERTPGERSGHAGLVTGAARKALSGDVFAPLLDMAANSLNEETQMLAAPAVAALAGVASNRKVLSSFGAVNAMLRLASEGKSVSVRMGAWDTIHQLLLSAEAVQRFIEIGGIPKALACVDEKSLKMRRRGAIVLERVFLKSTIPIAQRASLHNIAGLCKFVLCGDPQGSASAGAAILGMAKSSLDESFAWSAEHMEELCQVIAKGGGKRLSHSEGMTARKGHGHCLRALSLLAADRKTCAILTANTHTLALLLKGLFEHSIEYPQAISYHDLYYIRTIAQVGMACRTGDMVNDMEAIKWLTASLSRIHFALKESIPMGKLVSPRSGSEKKAESTLLPRELEMQHSTTMIINRFLFCLAPVRLEAYKTGLASVFLDLSLSRTIRVRQNAASCVFYMSLDPEVMADFGKPQTQSVMEKMLRVLGSTQDLLVRLTILRTLKQLAKIPHNHDGFYNARLVDLLARQVNSALGKTPDEAQLFPTMKCAFSASDILFQYMQEGASSVHLTELLAEREVRPWLESSCCELLERYGETAQAAMSNEQTRQAVNQLAGREPKIKKLLETIQAVKEANQRFKENSEVGGTDRLKRMFRRYDEDHSGSIDGDELYSLLRDLGHLCTRDEAMRIMSGMDGDGSGSIDVDEFLHWWNNAPFTTMFASSNVNR